MTRIAPLLIACGLLAGCTTVPAANQPSASTIADGSDVQLGIGETARLADGSRLSYLRLVNDSRCPPGVQCVWAGDAEIRLRWQPEDGSGSELSLHTSPLRGQGQTEATVGGLHIALQSLERGIAPKASLLVTATNP